MRTINGNMFAKMIKVSAKYLEVNREKIDSLNVFPVPDGDTGTNMSYTLKATVAEINKVDETSFKEISDAASKGALRGARGNSGVITSQIFRGICNVLKEVKKECDVRTFAKALKSGSEVAYSAVSKPQEGTILTVIRMMSEAAMDSKTKEFEEFFAEVTAAGQIALDKTPTLLPVLKKAGVVDSGGMGILTIIKGMEKAILGENIEGAIEEPEVIVTSDNGDIEHADILNLGAIEFGYCTEFFIIHIKKKTTLADIDSLREYLMSIGDSVLVIGDLEMVKVHVHTNAPGRALTKALDLGEIDRLKIDNLREQNRILIKKYKEERKPMGMLSICSGDGLTAIFKDINVDRVISGGQTMNPSASDIADAICKINAENIFVFPNNKNIILAAEQSKQLIEGKTVHVIPTTSIPQGIAAALAFSPEESIEVNKTNMFHAMDSIVSGQITYAVRTTNVDRISLNKGDIIGLDNKRILTKADDIETCLINLVEKLITPDHTVLNLYYGDTLLDEEAERIKDDVQEHFPNIAVELYNGGQPVYYWILSLE